MKVYGFRNSRSGRALWALEEAGADYAYQAIDPRAGDLSADWFRAVSPGGKVPVLVDGDLAVTESGAILNYIAARHPEAGLAPTDAKGRAHYDRWCFFTLTELEQPLWLFGKHKFALPRDWRVPEVHAVVPKEWGRAVAVLAVHLADGRDYVLGDAFSMADVLVGHTLAWARTLQLPLGGDDVEGYAARVLGRPALGRAMAREQAGE